VMPTQSRRPRVLYLMVWGLPRLDEISARYERPVSYQTLPHWVASWPIEG